MLKYNKNLKQISRTLRKNMTKEEIILWSRIRRRQIKKVQFYRKKPIGNFIADFYCPKEKLIIEIDGSQHYEKEGIEKDKIRDEYFKSLGLKVLRFTNLDVLRNLNGVLERIYENIPDLTTKSPQPLLRKGEYISPFHKERTRYVSPFRKGG